MKNTTMIIFTILITAILVGGGVYLFQKSQLEKLNQKNEETMGKEESPIENNSKTYKWITQNVSFKYIERYNILERSNSSLFITTATQLPDGDVSVFWTMIEIDSSTTFEKRLAEYKKGTDFTQSKEIIGGNKFTKVTFFSEFGGFTETHFLMEANGKLLDYKMGKGDEVLAVRVLESIKF